MTEGNQGEEEKDKEKAIPFPGDKKTSSRTHGKINSMM